MLGEARAALITAPHTSMIPGVMIFLIVMSINLLGDGVRDALDPRLRSGALSRPRAVTLVRRASVPAAAPPNAACWIWTGWRLNSMSAAASTARWAASTLGLAPGECLGLIGESGSGKSVTALSIMGLVASPPGVITGGAVRFEGRDLLALPYRDLRALRGKPRRLYLSGPAGDAAPALPHRRPVGRGDHRPWRRPARRRGPRGSSCCRPCASPIAESRMAELSARIVGRHAPAGRHRHGAGERSRRDHRRRADHRARRHRAGADPGAAGRTAPRRAIWRSCSSPTISASSASSATGWR